MCTYILQWTSQTTMTVKHHLNFHLLILLTCPLKPSFWSEALSCYNIILYCDCLSVCLHRFYCIDSELQGMRKKWSIVIVCCGLLHANVSCFTASAGNLGRVDYISEFEFDLFIRPDTCNPRFRVWFNFTVENVRETQVSMLWFYIVLPLIIKMKTFTVRFRDVR